MYIPVYSYDYDIPTREVTKWQS